MTEKRPVENVAARDTGHVWHWATALGDMNVQTRCAQDLEWLKVVKRPGPDHPLELEPGDTLCHACHGVRSFEGVVGYTKADLDRAYQQRDAAQSALTVRYAMRREIEAKLGMVSGEANDESLRRGLEAIRALELRAEKAEREGDEMKKRLLAGDINVVLGNGDMVDAGWTRQLDANNRLHATRVRAEKAERERDEARAQLLREAATTTRLTAYRILAQIAVDADDTDEAAADDLRSLLDVLWRQLTDVDRAALRDEAKVTGPYREVVPRPPCPRNCGLPDEEMEPIPKDADIAIQLMLSGFSSCFACGRKQRLFNADGTTTTAF